MSPIFLWLLVSKSLSAITTFYILLRVFPTRGKRASACALPFSIAVFIAEQMYKVFISPPRDTYNFMAIMAVHRKVAARFIAIPRTIVPFPSTVKYRLASGTSFIHT